MSILDLLQHIVNEPAPRLVSRYKQFPEEAVSFVEGCLDKDPGKRSPQDLLVRSARLRSQKPFLAFTTASCVTDHTVKASDWIIKSTMTPEDLRAWAGSLAS